jgi:hypothetical protein
MLLDNLTASFEEKWFAELVFTPNDPSLTIFRGLRHPMNWLEYSLVVNTPTLLKQPSSSGFPKFKTEFLIGLMLWGNTIPRITECILDTGSQFSLLPWSIGSNYLPANQLENTFSLSGATGSADAIYLGELSVSLTQDPHRQFRIPFATSRMYTRQRALLSSRDLFHHFEFRLTQGNPNQGLLAALNPTRFSIRPWQP